MLSGPCLVQLLEAPKVYINEVNVVHGAEQAGTFLSDGNRGTGLHVGLEHQIETYLHMNAIISNLSKQYIRM